MTNRPRYITISFLILSILAVSFCILIVYDSVDAQVNSNTLESIVNLTGSLNETAQINVDGSPQYIFGDLSSSDTIYVANYKGESRNGTVSAIDTTKYDVKNIPVGINPTSIFGDLFLSDLIYVLNSGPSSENLNGSVSVIDTTNNTLIQNIPVGINPIYIGKPSVFGELDEMDYIYVVNNGFYSHESSTVSVIDTTNNTVIQNIPVGIYPEYIFGFPGDNMIYVANSGSSTVSVIDTTTNKVIQNIPVGINPTYIYGNLAFTDRIYVLNSGYDFDFANNNGTVSVIDTTNNTVIQNISVGTYPTYISGEPEVSDDIYVLNSGYSFANISGSVSVIGTTNNTVIQNISVGIDPKYITSKLYNVGIFGYFFIYVANSGSSTVSVIDTTNNTVIQNISVGIDPRHIFGEPKVSDALYVSNFGSKGVSVINSMRNEVVAGITFDVNPFRSGEIICDTDVGNLDAPVDHFLYVSSGAKCTAKPNKGFEFSSWTETLDGNSTRTINASSGTPWTTFLDLFNIKLDDPATASPLTAFFSYVNVRSDDPAATLTVNRFGNFTAYFRALPPPVPAEYWASLFAVVATALIGSLLIPAVIGWFKSRRQTSRLNFYHQGMASLYEDDKLDEKDIAGLNTLNKNISNEYSQGKINNEQYAKLKKDVSVVYSEIFNKKLDSLNESPGVDVSREILLDKIKKQITDAYSKDKIIELHYNLLNDKISGMTSKGDVNNST